MARGSDAALADLKPALRLGNEVTTAQHKDAFICLELLLAVRRAIRGHVAKLHSFTPIWANTSLAPGCGYLDACCVSAWHSSQGRCDVWHPTW